MVKNQRIPRRLHHDVLDKRPVDAAGIQHPAFVLVRKAGEDQLVVVMRGPRAGKDAAGVEQTIRGAGSDLEMAMWATLLYLSLAGHWVTARCTDTPAGGKHYRVEAKP